MAFLGFKAVHLTQIEAQTVEKPGFEGVKVRWLITKDDGAENFAMRCFEIAPRGQSAHHSHGWEHEVFVLDGQGIVFCGNEERRIGPGHAVFVPPDVPHHFKNTEDETLRFLCLIPYKE